MLKEPKLKSPQFGKKGFVINVRDSFILELIVERECIQKEKILTYQQLAWTVIKQRGIFLK